MENLTKSQIAFLSRAEEVKGKIEKSEKLSEAERELLLAYYLNKKVTRKEQQYVHP